MRAIVRRNHPEVTTQDDSAALQHLVSIDLLRDVVQGVRATVAVVSLSHVKEKIMDATEVDVIDAGMIVAQTKGAVGCLVEALDCSPFAGPPWTYEVESDGLI